MKIDRITIESKTVLAPLAGISDSAFRRLARSFGAGLVFTEMVSVEGLLRRNRPSLQLLNFTEEERPIGAQLFGSRPESAEVGVRVAEEFRPDFIDFNAGCPVRKVVRKEGGAALLKDLKLLEEILRRMIEATELPVTLKLRSGWDEDSVVVEASQMAESLGCRTVTIHPRTQRQGFSGNADWELIAKVKEAVKIPVIGNGDVQTPQDAKRMLDETGCDAVMIGRAALGNPWIFSKTNHYLSAGELLPEPAIEERIEVFLKHVRFTREEIGEDRAMKRMRSRIGWYIKGLLYANRLRQRIIRIDRYDELEEVLQEYVNPASFREQIRNSNVFGPVTEDSTAFRVDLSKDERGAGTILQRRPETYQGAWSKHEREAEVKAFMSPRYQEMLNRWLEYRYLILEHSPKIYEGIQVLLQTPMTNETIMRIFSEIESALSQTPGDGRRVSAALHIWGKLKGKGKNGDKLHFLYFLDAFRRQRITIRGAKRILYRLAQKQRNEELLNSRYFDEIRLGCQEQEQTTSKAASCAEK
ncbi:MAG: tRNA dihydrouridine synthase DusB [Candidatus Zixiibacteriota bacterium]